MKPILALLLITWLSGCTVAGLLAGPDDFCQGTYADFPADFDKAISRELRQEPPNGALTKPYSREAWDAYWNHRIYYVWSVGPDTCDGTYEGPYGPTLVRDALAKRRVAGLPDVTLEPRNRDKVL
jgi:hypothetical protein